MKKSRVLAAFVTLGLAASASTPVMALENQVSGSYTIMYDLSNYNATGVLAHDAKTQNFIPQRVRLGYTAKANEDVKLVTKFEFDYNYLGNSSYAVARGGGGALGSDTINMETKNLYLDLNLPNKMNVKLGMMNNADSFKGMMFYYNDMAGIQLSQELGKAQVTAGLFRLAESNVSTIGKYTHDMLTIDGKYKVSKETNIGAAYYYISDNRDNGSTTTSSPNGAIIGYTAAGDAIYTLAPTITTTPNAANAVKVHTVGLNAETVVGPITLSGFALTQFGDLTSTQKAKGYAVNLGAKMPLAGGTARSEFIYAGGGKNSLYVLYGEGGAFYDGEMIILSRDKNNFAIDNAIVYDVNNGNQGVIMGTVGYDYPITDKLSGSVNAGFAAVADNSVAGRSNYLGTEVNFEANYKLMSNVTIGARAGYVFLGDYFKTSPSYDNPYDAKLIAQYSF